VTGEAIVRAWAPGRVNLIGEHTDHTGGLVLPIAVDLGTEIAGARGGDRLALASDAEPVALDVGLATAIASPATVEPPWGRYVAAVAAALDAREGLRGEVRTDLPLGAGLSSSAALEVATALALGFHGDAVELAMACRRAEHAATGVPTGIMDQLASAGATAGTAMLIDCATLAVEHVPVPQSLEIVVRFVERRSLVGSGYATRVAQCAAAEREIGPLRLATTDDVGRITDPTVRRRARHVVTENERVRAMVEALRGGDAATAGALLVEGHRSLRDDFEVSTSGIDLAVENLARTPGVLGARMTGGGFGGSVVVFAEPGTALDGWRVHPSDGALARRAKATD
jgi:galactokinase